MKEDIGKEGNYKRMSQVWKLSRRKNEFRYNVMMSTIAILFRKYGRRKNIKIDSMGYRITRKWKEEEKINRDDGGKCAELGK